MKRLTLLIAVIFFSLLCFTANAQDVGNMVQQKPFAISGSLGLGLGTYGVSGIADDSAISPIFLTVLP